MDKPEKTRSKAVLKAFGIPDAAIREEITAIKSISAGAEISFEKNLLDKTISFGCADEASLAKAVCSFTRRFAENIYAEYDVSLQTVLVDILKMGKLKISVAESFTGGNLASRIVSVPGASKVFYEGIVAYSEEAKAKRLGVSRESLKTNKPVSSQVAGEMAEGLLKERESDFVIATTGLAGPQSDESGFPVGLCYIAVGSAQGVTVYKYKFDGNREEITEKGVQTALFLAIKGVKNI